MAGPSLRKSSRLDPAKRRLKLLGKSGGTLYLVNKTTVTDTRKVNFNLTLSPSVDLDKIPPQFIQWQSQTSNLGKYWGQDKFNIISNENKDATVISKVGNPTLTTNSINIKWINENKVSGSFMPPATSSAITLAINTMETKLKTIQTLLQKVTFSNKNIISIDPIKIGGSKYNEEDFSSEKILNPTSKTLGSSEYLECTEGSISGGLTFADTLNLLPPTFSFINKSGLVKLMFFINPSLKFGVQATVLSKTTAISKKKVANNFSVVSNLSGCLSGGIIFKLLKFQETVQVDVKGAITGCVSGKIGWDFSNNNFIGKVTLDPVIATIALHIKTTEASFFEFDLVDVDLSYQLLDEYPIYEYQ